jgi:hypothetical protein
MFQAFPKIPRLTKDMVVTEKIDGTNGQIHIFSEKDFFSEADTPNIIGTVDVKIDGELFYLGAASRNRYLDQGSDNFGFHAWATKHAQELVDILGPGRHYGEWWGKGIQRGYGMEDKKFSLFNTGRWRREDEWKPWSVGAAIGLDVVPVLLGGVPFNTPTVLDLYDSLRTGGSVAAPGFMNSEGVVVYHEGMGKLFKHTGTNEPKRVFPRGEDKSD